ncbi:MAG: head GIN domain-containing protein [Bacteroidota bacterium]
MKFKLIFCLSLIGSSLLSAQEKTVDVGSFSKVSLGINATLYLKQGNEEKVTIDCSQEDFAKITFEQSGDRLTIKRKEKWNWKSDGFRDVDIYITMKEIERVSLSGSGNIKGKSTLNTEDLDLTISGSGEMDLDVSSDEVEMRISGSGDIELRGNAEEASARISGSGKVKAEDLKVKTFEASISGSGSCYVTALEEIEANISGSGNVYYSGDPERVIANSSGSGKIKKM